VWSRTRSCGEPHANPARVRALNHVRRTGFLSGPAETWWRVENGDCRARRMEVASVMREEGRCIRQGPSRNRGVPCPGIQLYVERPGGYRRRCRLPGTKRSGTRARQRWGRKLLVLPGPIIDRLLESRRKSHRIKPGCDKVGTTGFRGTRRKESQRQERCNNSCPRKDQSPERKGPCHSLGFAGRTPPPS
jgi:hypothetical protein